MAFHRSEDSIKLGIDRCRRREKHREPAIKRYGSRWGSRKHEKRMWNRIFDCLDDLSTNEYRGWMLTSAGERRYEAHIRMTLRQSFKPLPWGRRRYSSNAIYQRVEFKTCTSSLRKIHKRGRSAESDR